MKKTNDCESHGFRRPAYVCQHLNLKNKKEFEEPFEVFRGMELVDEDDFCAGCNDCEKIRIEQDGWNDDSEKFAKIKLVWEECFSNLKNLVRIKKLWITQAINNTDLGCSRRVCVFL